jgi:5'-nucleotidase
MDFRLGTAFGFQTAAAFTARIVDELSDVPLSPGTLLNINVPAGAPEGVRVTTLGKRIYRDELKHTTTDEDGRNVYWVYGVDPDFHDEPGTDLAAVAAQHISVTPIHFDLTHHAGLDALVEHDLSRFLRSAREPTE